MVVKPKGFTDLDKLNLVKFANLMVDLLDFSQFSILPQLTQKMTLNYEVIKMTQK